MKRSISIVWDIEDVKSLDGDLSDDQALGILLTAEHQHDASIGVNWDVLQYWIDEFRAGKYCPKYGDPVLPDEQGNCSLCGQHAA
jgi:hypothetical protein